MENYKPKECDYMNLLEEGKITKFYDDRYRNGYMEEWAIEKKQRIFEIVKSFNLPDTGDALDFGCGNGVFTSIIKQALPGWNVYGMDISSIAVDNARKRYPDCSFFLPSDGKFGGKRFDFLFTHHVLEHVCDVSEAWYEMNGYLKEKASILHILPCGNEGSLEHKICLLNKEGIIKDKEDKFFFEDITHLRRLNTEQMGRYALQYGFNLNLEYYSHQFYGALEWITSKCPRIVLEMTNLKGAKDVGAAFKLAWLRIMLLMIKIMRFPANTIDHKKEKMKNYEYDFFILMLLIFYPFSKLTNICLTYLSNSEWKRCRSKKNGSEMYLCYERARSA